MPRRGKSETLEQNTTGLHNRSSMPRPSLTKQAPASALELQVNGIQAWPAAEQILYLALGPGLGWLLCVTATHGLFFCATLSLSES